MVSQDAMRKIAESAYVAIQKSGLEEDWVVPPTRLAKRMSAVRFAQAVTKKRYGTSAVIGDYPLPIKGYLSWLLVQPLGIAFDSSQVFGQGSAPENVPDVEVQISRAVLHECGHILGTPELLSREGRRRTIGGRRFTECCSPEEEERAWVWALCALGIALGHHARKQREDRRIDNTPGLLI
ncbi:MAG: hypothetical protein ACYTEL_11480 [Planctomycetota bacterium]|jgi:hypothetical protein